MYTLGDPRFPACLGREADSLLPSPSSSLFPVGRVTSLDDLPTGPVTKLVSAGYTTVVLTEGGDLYVWGGHPGENHENLSANSLARTLIRATESGNKHDDYRRDREQEEEDPTVPEPTPVVVFHGETGEERDVADVGIGEGHAIVLTTDGEVYVLGTNRNGQLGIGIGDDEVVEGWKKVNLELRSGDKIIGVAAGPRCSFIIVKHGDF